MEVYGDTALIWALIFLCSICNHYGGYYVLQTGTGSKTNRYTYHLPGCCFDFGCGHIRNWTSLVLERSNICFYSHFCILFGIWSSSLNSAYPWSIRLCQTIAATLLTLILQSIKRNMQEATTVKRKKPLERGREKETPRQKYFLKETQIKRLARVIIIWKRIMVVEMVRRNK